jgi:predicted membrane protein
MRRIDAHMECRTNPDYRPNKYKRLIIGLLIIFFGSMLLLHNFEILSGQAAHIIFSWKSILIALGIINLFGHKKWAGIVLIAVGTFFMLPEFFCFPFEFKKLFWPVIIMMFGIFILIAGRRHHRAHHAEFSSEEFIDEIAIFSGVEKTITSSAFKGGKVTSVFGGIEIDLTQSKLAEGINYIDLTTVFGGAKFIIPSDWNVKVEVTSVFGGFEDKRGNVVGDIDSGRSLVMKGSVVFGGGEIKRV